jgi:protoporphyrinogen/coproporphyrinogen III oxidase
LTTFAVAGGGITGLVSAHELERLHPSAEVTLFEAGDRIGGKIGTIEMEGAVVDTGPDWFVTRDGSAVELCMELGLRDHLITPDVAGALIYSRDRLLPIPKGFVRGFPASIRALFGCRQLSAAGRLRATADLVTRSPLVGPDVSIGAFARSRFGPELLDRLVAPILAASRAGTADELSLAAAAPEIDAAARSGKSLLMGLRATRDDAPGGPPFLGIRGGMARLVDALTWSLERTEIRTATRVDHVHALPRGYDVRAPGASVEADGVVLALPAHSAAPLLASIDASLARKLAVIAYADAAVISLLYPPGRAEPPPDVSGVLIPGSENRFLTAFAWFSAKWSQARPDGGAMVMRCFAGRTQDDPALDLDDDELVGRAAADLAGIAGVKGEPSARSVTRHRAALPIYRVGHLDLIEDIERSLPDGLALAGAGYRGSGIPDCIRQGRAAAHRIMRR